MVIRCSGSFENGGSWSEIIDSPWLGLYEINDDEPVTVREKFMSDADVEEHSFACFHTTGSDSEPDKSSDRGYSISQDDKPDLSAFEFDDDDDDDDDMPNITMGRLILLDACIHEFPGLVAHKTH